MSKPNFRTSLPWEKALELLNKLAEHMVDTDSDGEVVYYIQIEINEKTKNWLTNLGVNLNELGEDFYNPDKNWFDLMPIWDEIQSHYGHNLYYTGKEFVVWDEEKEQLLSKMTKAEILILNAFLDKARRTNHDLWSQTIDQQKN